MEDFDMAKSLSIAGTLLAAALVLSPVAQGVYGPRIET